MYIPLKIEALEIAGVQSALESMRYPMEGRVSNRTDRELSRLLAKRGDDHAKHLRGVMVWARMELQAGFMIELETYNIGVTKLPCTSTMHNELKGFKGEALAFQKQEGLSEKVYKRMSIFSFQTLMRILDQRRNHRHPDWQIFCGWIEELPYFKALCMEEV